MLSLFGRDEAIRNIYRLAQVERPDCRISTTSELHSVYLDFLDHRQGGIGNREDDIFVQDSRLEATLAAAFVDGALNDLNQADLLGERYPDAVRIRKTEQARTALIDVLNMDDDFASIFSLAIHSVIIRPSKPAKGIKGSHGGSSSAAIGSIWLAVGDSVTTLDLIEMYVHELTHHLLFIDELNHPQFNYRGIVQKQNFALSTILRKQRPLDKVIHSIVVGAELLEARNKFIGNDQRTLIHPATPQLAEDGLASIASVQALPNIGDLITPHTQQILARCLDVFQENRSEHHASAIPA